MGLSAVAIRSGEFDYTLTHDTIRQSATLYTARQSKCEGSISYTDLRTY